ncbi:electron transfer flavoprotein alpha subunit [Lewinella marina]|uniref:Electron transfer flavoprotein subunit alpha n=1 Tax=Neolewinella marina TaxID=438751 RepID=A0A2G0CGA5_9BACT|nr:electron transfer flavoprotein subunit alpha/FixB family protein [Neolewinella marina]NJB86540.1 electron transfer flavoprotein alpha subunit [Neolewinella marina]PHK99006.1 electron transfer flavoprotein subunit alpha [Neolewinella marina]
MVLVYAEATNGEFKKVAQEAVVYGRKTAEVLGTECHAVVLGDHAGAEALGKFGATKVHRISGEPLKNFDAAVYTVALSEAAKQLGATVIILPHNSTGKNITGRLAARLEAGSVTGANAVPEMKDGYFTVTKPVFSGKAFAHVQLLTDVKVISLAGNSIPVTETGGEAAVSDLSIDLPQPKTRVVKHQVASGRVPLPEAELVVSGGRGLKGPENWSVIEDLAEALGATTACSRPVADSDWRPHHEHVGQTGVAIRPNLYIAAGISGAIQHLAGVNNSKTIVVVNKDPEAPFFKAADYGVVGDLFEVLPRLTEAVKKYKGQ